MQLIECVPNFSEGKNKEIIDKIISPIKSNSQVTLLDVDPGFDTNRTVVTFIGPPETVVSVAFECIKLASELIDMSKHKGEHPRMGATDVCPLIPIQNTTMDECVKYSKNLAKKVGKSLNIPVYLYENSATSKSRRNLSFIRKGEYEAIKDKIKENIWKPDFGKSEFNSKSGCTAIGAREFLIAYNINLNTFDKKIATDIALDIREAGRAKRDSQGKILRNKDNSIIKVPGKLKFCKAVGWYIDEYKQAQVSINLTNYKRTSLHKTFEEVRKQARKRGVRVTGSEIVGLLPKQALINSGKFYLKKQKRSTGIPEVDILDIASKSLGLSDISEFNIYDKIIDYKINTNQNKLTNLDISSFLDTVSRGTATPGGGSVSALAGALGVSLSAMVSNLTINKKGFENNYDKYISIGENCQKLKKELDTLVDLDTNAYNKVINAVRLPKKTELDKKNRLKAIDDANIFAAQVPLEILEKCISGMKQTLLISEIGNPNSITDIGVAAELLHAGIEGAAMNIQINIQDIDKKRKIDFENKIDYYLKESKDLFISIKKNIKNILK